MPDAYVEPLGGRGVCMREQAIVVYMFFIIPYHPSIYSSASPFPICFLIHLATSQSQNIRSEVLKKEMSSAITGKTTTLAFNTF
jgi:hypothetical protein